MNVPGDSRTFFYNAGANAHFDEHTLSMEAIAANRPSIFYLGYLNLLPLLDAIDGQEANCKEEQQQGNAVV